MRTGRDIRAVRLPGSGFVTGCCCFLIWNGADFPSYFARIGTARPNFR